MKSKTIKSILSKKFNEFANSIENEEVKKLVIENSIITGGCITSMLLNEKVNDFDLYFTNKETTFKVAEYYVEKFKKTDNTYNMYVEEKDGRIKIIVKSDGLAQVENDFDVDSIIDKIGESDEIESEMIESEQDGEKYRPIYLSTNAITLSNKIQLVVRFYGDADEIHANYDFEHTKCYWRSKDGFLNLPARSLESILNKELFYTGSKYPLCSVIRTRKFIRRGWQINAGQYLKMCFQISELDLKDLEVLEDQLIGVDSAYFNSVIENLKKKKEEDENFKFDNQYLITIIDKIF